MTSVCKQDIFDSAANLLDLEERAAFLEQACAGNEALRREIEDLLRYDADPRSFLISRTSAFTQDTTNHVQAVAASTVIGPYKILRRIGEGGMGAVYLAEQTHPVRREVALKLIRPGLDSRQVIARFEAERQALAMMDHPNIAKVLDAGTSEAGQPYFVMELVRGVPITEFCDGQRLVPRQRLALFVSVCQAVQHAHQKGIVHRDIKPSNVLVALFDGEPVAKVIDFGVAKAIGPKIANSTLLTEFGSIVGTLEYMSPEQATHSQFDIDTRSDIYSLGVLLYELLTGTTPLDKKRLQSSAILELLRVIKEEEPQRPSTRLSSSNELPSIAANRNLEPKKLSSLMRGELDWIVMKALDKDRNRRYETAYGFAKDVQRFLSEEPVTACPPSSLYRLRKFVRRNKWAMAVASTVVGSAVIGLVLTVVLLTIHSARIQAAQQKTDQQYHRAENALVEANENLVRADSNLKLALEALDDLCLKDVENRVNRDWRMSAAERESLERGLAFYGRLAAQNSDHEELQGVVAKANRRAGFLSLGLEDWPEACSRFRMALPVFEKLSSESTDSTQCRIELASCCYGLGRALLRSGRPEEAEPNYRRAVAVWKKLADEFPQVPQYRTELGHNQWHLSGDFDKLLFGTGDPDEIEGIARALRIFEQLAAEDPKNGYYQQETGFGYRHLCNILVKNNRYPEAVAVLRQAVSVYEALVDESKGHPFYRQELAICYMTLGDWLQETHELAEAEAAYRSGLTRFAGIVIETNQEPHRHGLACFHKKLGILLRQAGRFEDAAEQLRAALAVWEKLLTEYDKPDHRRHWTDTHRALADLLSSQAAAVAEDTKLSLAERQDAAKAYGDELERLMRDALANKAQLITASDIANYPVEVSSLTKSLVRASQRPQANRLELLRVMQRLGNACLTQHKHAEAEQLFRACLPLCEQEEPKAWTTSGTQARLGLALLALARHADAKPYLLQGYQGLKQQEANIPQEEQHCVFETLCGIVELLDASEHSKATDGSPVTAVAQNPVTRHFYRSALAARRGDWATALSESTAVLDIEPRHLEARQLRAELFLRVGLLSEAAADNLLLFREREPSDSLGFLQHALLCRSVEDEANYRDACERMLARFADSTEHADWDRIAIVLAAAPQSVVEPSRIVAFAERAVAGGKIVFRQAYLGLAYYRSGQFDQAASALEESLAIDANHFPAVVHSIQAMTEHRRGNAQAATDALKTALRARDANTEAMLAKDVGHWPAPWWDVLHGQLLYREAYELIHGAPMPVDTQLLALRRRALRAIRTPDEATDSQQGGR